MDLNKLKMPWLLVKMRGLNQFDIRFGNPGGMGPGDLERISFHLHQKLHEEHARLIREHDTAKEEAGGED